MKRIYPVRLRLLMVLVMPLLFISPAHALEKIFAPYVDVMLYPAFSLNDAHDQTGQPYYTLAFITADSSCRPAWGGITALEKDHYMDEINALRQSGGDVIISFGGANGTELAMCHGDAGALQAAYQSVIDKYQVNWVDFDIEGWAVAERTSIDLRNKAIRGLQEANPDLTVAFCLPVLPSGLTHDGLYVLENARDNGVRVDVVNVMAMDYGDGAAPDPEGNMGQYAIDAAVNTYQQALDLGLSPLMGITPMIGQNDVASERFYLSDAEMLLAWAQSKDWVGMLSMWSSTRDNGRCPNNPWADATCSGLDQADFAFTSIFRPFTGGTIGNVPPQVAITRPLDGDLMEPGSSVTISVNASDVDGAVVQVEILVDGESMGTIKESPYTFLWTGVTEGVYVITAIATDDQGATGRSGAVEITVGNAPPVSSWDPAQVYWGGDEVCHKGKLWRAKWWTQGEEPGTTGKWGVWEALGWCNGNKVPAITITSPEDGDKFDPGDTLTLSADASDPDGSVVQVEFFLDSTSLGTDDTPPYAIAWHGIPEGSYVITAVATDDQGAATQSTGIQIKVGEATPDVPAWDPSEVYWGGDMVFHNGKTWRAKWWTRGEEPGTTGEWGVWEEVR